MYPKGSCPGRPRSARDADLIIYVADSSREPDENDEELLSFIQDRQAVILLNKSDLSPVYTEDALKRRTEHPVIPFSARDGVGMDILEKALRDIEYSENRGFALDFSLIWRTLRTMATGEGAR